MAVSVCKFIIKGVRSLLHGVMKPFAVPRLRARMLPHREGRVFRLGLWSDMTAYSRFLKSLGEGSRIHPSVEIRSPENVKIGSNCGINHGAELYGGGGIEIGDGTLIAYHVLVFSDTREYRNRDPITKQVRIVKPVRIGKDVWIGARAIILPGVEIADHAVVGAGSVVTKNVGEWEIVAGNPARKIRSRLN